MSTPSQAACDSSDEKAVEESCICQTRFVGRGLDLLREFGQVRKECEALRSVFVPDAIWQDFQLLNQQPPDAAEHLSVLLCAYKRGYLARITSPIHLFLIAHGKVRPDLRKQYAQDLQERWLLGTSERERHERSRIFMGRLIELQMATYLAGEGWQNISLEALREGPDIEATRDGRRTAFEVKYIGVDNEAFEAEIKSAAHNPLPYPNFRYCPNVCCRRF